MNSTAPIPIENSLPSDASRHPGGAPGVLLEYIRRTEFKRLMNQVVGAQQRLGFGGLVVLSALPGEGRTFFTGALALAYAKFLHRRVLILDGTARGRDGGGLLHALVGEHLSLGLRAKGAPHFERGRIDLITVSNLSQLERESPDFYIGPYLEQVGHHYDLVLVDTAPVGAVSRDDLDPIILAQHVGYAVLLTSKYSLDRSAITKLCELLRQYDTGLIGTVYNHGAS